METTINWLLTFLVGIIGAFIGSMAGGGGLVSIPFFIFLGLPPQVAIATTKLGGLGLYLAALPKFSQNKKIDWRYVLPLSLVSLVGALVGAEILLSIDPKILTRLIGFILVALLPLFFIKDLGVVKVEAGRTRRYLGYFVWVFVSIFAGFFGGGGSTLAIYALVLFFGFTMIESSATAMIPWLVLVVAALVVFVQKGIVSYFFGSAIFFGMALGGYLGVKVALKKGDQWVKIFFSLVLLAAAIKLIFF